MQIHLEAISCNSARQTVTTIVVAAGEAFYIARFADEGVNRVILSINTRILTGFR
jgi:hypothetical protein